MNKYEIVMHVFRTIKADNVNDVNDKIAADIDTIQTVVDPDCYVEHEIADVEKDEDAVDDNAIDQAIEDEVRERSA